MPDAETLRVRVRYPLTGGRIVLRTAHDWERDIEPRRADRAGTRFDYEVDLAGSPFCYFKPVLVEGGRESWAQGANYLALRNGGGRREIYPHFNGDSACRVCRLERRVAPEGGRAHRFRVFTPPGYDENTLEAYPVLYMQDGQNLFFPQEAYGGQPWRVEETLARLNAMNLVRRMIVVGVWPEDRMEDYTLPGYEAYGRFFADEIQAFVDTHYRTLRGPRHTAVLGSSLGGVVSLYLGWQYPERFGLVGCMSSTFGWKDDLVERIGREERRAIRVYLDSGWPGDNYEVTLAMRNLLLARGYTEGSDLSYVAFPDAEHDERAWSARLHQPLQFFFGARA